MTDNLKRYLFISQSSLFASILICSLITPSVITSEGGISDFGNHLSTVTIYILGYILDIYFVYLSARTILKKSIKLRHFYRGLMMLCYLTILVFLSTFPRHFSFTFSYVHDYLAIVLFSYEFIVSVLLAIKWPSYKLAAMLLLESIGSGMALLSILKIIHLLYVGQVIGGLGFALILVLALPDIVQSRLHIK